MKRTLFSMLILFLFTACNEGNKADYAIISGKIANYDNELIGVAHGEKFVKELFNADKNGVFQDTIYQLGNKEYSLFIGKNRIPVFLQKGTNISIEFAENQVVKVSGNDAKSTEYLISRDEFLAGKIDASGVFAQRPDEFKTNVEVIFSELREKLTNSGLDKKFTENQQKWLDYRFIQYLNGYLENNKYLTGNEQTLPDGFFAEAEKINMDNMEDYENMSNYEDIVRQHFLKMIQDPNDTKQVQALFKELDAVKTQSIRNDICEALVGMITKENPNNKLIFTYIMENVTSEMVREIAENNFENINK